jgi:hypothetical protein
MGRKRADFFRPFFICVNNVMARYKIITFVDITRSNPSRSETDKIKLGQQANFNSLLQAIGLRANIEWNADPILNDGRLPHPMTGKAKHWIWEFDTERDYLFQKDTDPVGLLLDDLDGVPIVDQLNNNVDIAPAVFKTKGDKPNTWVYELANSI